MQRIALKQFGTSTLKTHVQLIQIKFFDCC